MVRDLLAVRAVLGHEVDPDRCWADAEPREKPWACGRTDTDALGLCPLHRAKLFGKVEPSAVLPGSRQT